MYIIYLMFINGGVVWCYIYLLGSKIFISQFQELSIDLEVDPMSLPEMHEHMIRSPPPTNWPKSPNHRIFQFPSDGDTLHVEMHVSKYQESKYIYIYRSFCSYIVESMTYLLCMHSYSNNDKCMHKSRF